MADRSSGGGFAQFVQTEKHRQKDIASKSGGSSGSNFANDRQKASEAGRKGGKK